MTATLVLIRPRGPGDPFLDSDAAGGAVRQHLGARLRERFARFGVIASASALPPGQLAGPGLVLIVDERAWFPLDATVGEWSRAIEGSRSCRMVSHQGETVAVLVERRVLLTEAEKGTVDSACAELLDRAARPGEVANVVSEGLLVNGYDDVARVEADVLKGRAERAMASGVRLRDPARVYIRGSLTCGSNVTIETDVIFEGAVTLGDGVKVDAHCIVRGATIGPGTWVKAFSLIEDAEVGADCFVGPYARIRPASTIGDRCQIGNFVEIKSATIGTGSRINHHSFIGDAELADRVTIGAGTITCNHDGTKTHRTVIGADAYIGSGCFLIAPLQVGAAATIAAGSTITDDVPGGMLTIARARQVTVPGWRRPGMRGPKP